MNKNYNASEIKVKTLNLFSLRFNLLFTLPLVCALSFMALSPAHAQISGNVRTPTTTPGQSGGNDAPSATSYLTDRSVQLNATGSCDSTCDAMGGVAPPTSIVSSLQTRVQACATGYTGQRSQTRTQNADGTFSPWVDASTSQCICAPTHQDTTQTCASPLGGTFVQRTNWTCSANVGSWGTPFTQTSSCFTPCAVPATQYTSGACPAGYLGAYYYQNVGVCPGGAGSNSSPSYSGWTMYSNQCALPRFSYGQFLSVWWPGGGGECDSGCPPGYGMVWNNTGYNISLPAVSNWAFSVPATNWAPGAAITLPWEVYQWSYAIPFPIGNGQSLQWQSGPTYPAVLN